MIFGKNKTQNSPAAQSANAVIFDVSVQDFEQRVIATSLEIPVIVDFWAPWCGPCKQLMPVLEKVVQAAGGKVLLAKVNIDENQQLAAALRIQSVPTVFAFFQGRPVDAFQGVLPESQLKAFVDKLIQLSRQAQPDALDIPQALGMAAEALKQKDFATAQALYAQILQQDEKNAPAYAGMVRVYLAAGAIDQATALLENAPPELAKHPNMQEARTALELARVKPAGPLDDLAAKIAAEPQNHQTRIDYAVALFAADHKEQAIDQLLESIATNREWNEQAARKQLLKFFEALGHGDPLTVEGRKKLSSILFS